MSLNYVFLESDTYGLRYLLSMTFFFVEIQGVHDEQICRIILHLDRSTCSEFK
jgi:hypothetical protein